MASCDKALEARKKELDLTKLALDYSVDTNKKLAEQVKEKDEQLGSIWRSPYLWFGLGVLGTSILYGVTR